MREFLIEREQTLPQGIDDVFRFFADPRNLGELTPPWLHFRVVGSSTPSIGEGTVIDYKLRIRGIPLRWRSVIRAWEPPLRFLDEQLVGPYRRWIHEHSFQDLGGKTRVGDRVRYSVRGGALVERFLVRPDVERIFDYREQRLRALLGA
jgi:ligand-binding SRPBCC domain-containing protein